MTKNLERISPWWDRRVMGGLLVAVLPVTVVAAAVGSMPEVSVVKVSLLLALWCVIGWAARTQLVPSASVSASVLVVRNLYSTYEIPWQTLAGIDWEPRSGVLSLDLADGQRVPVQAFSRWPSFGRHRKVIGTLEEGRRLAAAGQSGTGTGPAADEVRVTGASGITEFLLALCFGGALVALVIEGVIALLD
ncbi:PH domain-containing protein [Streptomyces sp. STR69]|uniref:PH domain-containing protein n=1 Tax=Streptomyces sp. STR69 TaxID=1796942 RepID=UPI0021C7102E|nr:PH domain-containing protein [Streptomyces sp. STR69]